MKAVEVNFDAIVGPTHNYAGLAYGNIASQKSRHSLSNPRGAALEGLAKMKFLADLGIPQAVLPPPIRPDMQTLRSLGFGGSDAQVLQTVANEDPVLLAAISSASAMWAANAATVSPSADCADGKLHLSPANLISQLHRSIEARTTAALLKSIFPDPQLFTHHPPLPCQTRWADEGAANHTRFCADYGGPGVQLFVYGRGIESAGQQPSRYPARQTDQASRAIARRHQLDPRCTLFAQQNPQVIDAGVFHNDVAAVGNQNVLLCHARAWLNQSEILNQLRSTFSEVTGATLHIIEVPDDLLTLEQAVETYLFNSQLVTLPDGTMALIAPDEFFSLPRAREIVDFILHACPLIRRVERVSVRQSMRNGGGPACLRLRVVLTEAELAKTHKVVFLNAALYDRLAAWVNQHYREQLGPADLADVKLLEESRAAIEDLHRILALPAPSSA